MRTRLVILLLAAVLAKPVLAQQQFSSGPGQVTLLELYTSEGCSSCPPAERWFNNLREHPRLWQDIVPAVFHVDYWNYLGWDDRFARAEYSSRQRRYKSEGTVNSVYTPGVMALGWEWREWRRRSAELPVTGETVGNLALEIDGSSLSATFESAAATEPLDLYVAVLGFGLETPVRAGENRGELLQHEFVVLGLKRYSGKQSWRGELPDTRHSDEADATAIAAWVTPRGSQRPLQAVGGWWQ